MKLSLNAQLKHNLCMHVAASLISSVNHIFHISSFVNVLVAKFSPYRFFVRAEKQDEVVRL